MSAVAGDASAGDAAAAAGQGAADAAGAEGGGVVKQEQAQPDGAVAPAPAKPLSWAELAKKNAPPAPPVEAKASQHVPDAAAAGGRAGGVGMPA